MFFGRKSKTGDKKPSFEERYRANLREKMLEEIERLTHDRPAQVIYYDGNGVYNDVLKEMGTRGYRAISVGINKYGSIGMLFERKGDSPK